LNLALDLGENAKMATQLTQRNLSFEENVLFRLFVSLLRYLPSYLAILITV